MGFRTAPSAQAEAQLLALCRWRQQTKSHDALAILLWSDGWDISVARVRRALQHWLPLSAPPDLTTPAKREELTERLDQMALKVAPRLKARFGRRGLTAADIADAVLPVLRRVAGLKAQIRDRDARVVERLTGIDRGRVDSLGDIEPWLSERPREAFDRIPILTIQSAEEFLNGVTDEDLAEARPLLPLWMRTGPSVARRLVDTGDPEFAGLHVFGILPPKRAVEALFIVLLFNKIGLAEELRQALVGLKAGLDQDPSDPS